MDAAQGYTHDMECSLLSSPPVALNQTETRRRIQMELGSTLRTFHHVYTSHHRAPLATELSRAILAGDFALKSKSSKKSGADGQALTTEGAGN